MKRLGNGTKKKMTQLVGAISLFLLYQLWNVLFTGNGCWENVVLGIGCVYLLLKVLAGQEQTEEEEDERED